MAVGQVPDSAEKNQSLQTQKYAAEYSQNQFNWHGAWQNHLNQIIHKEDGRKKAEGNHLWELRAKTSVFIQKMPTDSLMFP